MRLFVAIVNYGRPDLTIDCLKTAVPEARAVEAEGRGSCVIGLCDNGSTNDSLEQLTRAIEECSWSDCVQLTAISPNRGFTGGNNAIIGPAMEREDKPEFVLLLNNDTLVHEGAFRTMLAAFDDLPSDVGLVSPRLEWDDGEAQISCFRDFSPLGELVHAAATGPVTILFKRWEVPIPVQGDVSYPRWTSFACVMIRRAVLAQVGLLDEGFFLYFDDPDFCRRARGSGWRIANVPKARVVHLRGQSNPQKQLAAECKRQPWYRYASRTRYYRKHYGPLGPLAANVCWYAGFLIERLRVLFGKPSQVCDREPIDIWTNFLHPLALPTRGQDE